MSLSDNVRVKSVRTQSISVSDNVSVTKCQCQTMSGSSECKTQMMSESSSFQSQIILLSRNKEYQRKWILKENEMWKIKMKSQKESEKKKFSELKNFSTQSMSV